MTFSTTPIPLFTDADGVVRVGGTRVTLDTVVAAFREGKTAEGIADQYPTLALPDIYFTLGFVLSHPLEIEKYLLHRQEQAARARQDNDARCDPHGIRERLLARSPELNPHAAVGGRREL